MIELAHVKEIKFSGNEAKNCGRHRKYLLCFFHFSARSDEHLCVCVVYFSLPHVCGGNLRDPSQGQQGHRCISGREKVSKATSDLSPSPMAQPAVGILHLSWVNGAVHHRAPVLIISDGTFYVTLNVFLVYVTGPRANTKGHVINLCVNLTCSTLTRDTNLKHKYTNPTTSSSSFVFLIYKGIQIHRSFRFLWF